MVANAAGGRANRDEGQPDHRFIVARFLLTPGRTYENAVKEFGPYKETKATDPDARSAGRALIAQAAEDRGRDSFIYVNNRLEGNAPKTIEAMVD